MKIILMLIVGLMLAGCESTENHVRNRVALSQNFHEGQKFDAKFGGF